jgi:hypothetical protein
MTQMQALIKQADQARQQGSNYSQAKADTSAGLVRCYRDYSVYKNGSPSHARTTWKLNDKTISADRLTALITD